MNTKEIMNPKISVIMSVKNGEKWLAESIKSIIKQTFKNFEFLIMNDCSDDKTHHILEYYSELDMRIKVFNNKKSIGLPASLNKLIKISKGQYIARMDADDVSYNTRLEKQLHYLEKNKKIDICFTDVNLITGNGNTICKKWVPKNIKVLLLIMPYINYITHPSVFLRKKIIDSFGCYNEKFLKGQDHELWNRYIRKNSKFFHIKEILIDYRIGIISNSSSLSSINRLDESSFIANILALNNQKLRSLIYIRKCKYNQLLKYFIKLIIPKYIFILFCIINVTFNKNAVINKLYKQNDI